MFLHPGILRKKIVHYIEKYFPGVCIKKIIIVTLHLWGSRMQRKKKTSGGKPAVGMQAHFRYP